LPSICYFHTEQSWADPLAVYWRYYCSQQVKNDAEILISSFSFKARKLQGVELNMYMHINRNYISQAPKLSTMACQT
jgi:hypothetical protein